MIRVLASLTVFLGGVLLFVLQPMVAKPLLPALGGSSMVWNTLLLLFQSLLLVGYFYAWGWKHLPLKIACVLQVAFLVVLALCALPLPIDTASEVNHLTPWRSTLLYGLSVVGLPFIFLSTTVSMVQRLKISVNPSSEPYHLYAFSNAGSFMGLFLYPLVLEPYLSVQEQVNVWSVGAIVWGMFFIVCLLKARNATTLQAGEGGEPPTAKPTWKALSYFALLAFIPSSLMHGVTFFITTDIAAFPMFWVLPLGIFLLTYILAFAGVKIGRLQDTALISRVIIGFVLAYILIGKNASISMIGAHIMMYFLVAYHVHRILYEARPHKSHLEVYYLSIAVGGVLGGVFHVLIAPMLFKSMLWEYPLSLLLAVVVGPMPVLFKAETKKMHTLFAGAMLMCLGLVFAIGLAERYVLSLFVLLAGCVLLMAHRYAFSVLCLACMVLSLSAGAYIYTDRSFYGYYRVFDNEKIAVRYMMHGSTIHGVESLTPGRKGWSYYKPASAAFELLDPTFTQLDVAMVGLGTGGMADFYGNTGRAFDFYEIDPAVVNIARDSGLFTYLKNASDLGVNLSYTIGDGRLNLSQSQKQYNIIVLDAFSSDAVPVHMLTLEAMQGYLARLKDGGIVLYNVSNRHFNFIPLLFKQAQKLGVRPLAINVETDFKELIYASQWVALVPNQELYDGMMSYGWGPIEQEVVDAAPLWTDEKNSALKVLRAIDAFKHKADVSEKDADE